MTPNNCQTTVKRLSNACQTTARVKEHPRPDRDPKRPGEPKVRELEHAHAVDEQVLQRLPTTPNNCQTTPNDSQRLPTTPNDSQRLPTTARSTTANDCQINNCQTTVKRLSNACQPPVKRLCTHVLTGIPNALASPKSASLSTPMRSMSRFCGFMSRWSTRFPWQ
jgi:hypothetical protein